MEGFKLTTLTIVHILKRLCRWANPTEPRVTLWLATRILLLSRLTLVIYMFSPYTLTCLAYMFSPSTLIKCSPIS
ncbi:hypothetical protein HanRHA438_Chr03g0117021 [Helianthus annuus]|nr:hypothetical protein HanRHA438_Chr03g0117021 [Helianthus annuus]